MASKSIREAMHDLIIAIALGALLSLAWSGISIERSLAVIASPPAMDSVPTCAASLSWQE